MDTPHYFSVIVYKGDNFCRFLFAFLHIKPLLKGVYSKRKKKKKMVPLFDLTFLVCNRVRKVLQLYRGSNSGPSEYRSTAIRPPLSKVFIFKPCFIRVSM